MILKSLEKKLYNRVKKIYRSKKHKGYKSNRLLVHAKKINKEITNKIYKEELLDQTFTMKNIFNLLKCKHTK